MKKVLLILLTLVLVAALAMPVLAISGSVSLGASASTLHRGDTFTVTATLSTSDAIALGTVKLSYDSSALEMTGGSCHVAGASLSQVLPGNKAGTFMLSGDPALISGKIFTFNFKVKDTAAFGSYTISSSASIGIEVGQGISSGSTSVTVACKHSYGDWSKIDDADHQHTCSICGDVQKEAHTWDSGTVITPATCTATGTQKLTCTGCGATKEATIPVGNNHKYGNWSESGSGHSRTCSICSKVDTAAHTWNSGKVLTAATCTATGTKEVTCTACSVKKTVEVPKTAHTYGASTYVDDSNHTHTCTLCGLATTEAHDYGSTYIHDENWHFLRCAGCGHEKEQAAHVPGPEATEDTDQICTVCNRILKPMGKHVHSFAEEWSTDETGHWHSCSACSEKDSAAPHEYDDDCDAECNICLFERQPLHPAAAEWCCDESGHWYACSACGEKVSFAAHTPGPEATVSSAQSCTVCQFEIAPILPHDHIYDVGGTTHSHSCACGETYTAEAANCAVCKGFPWRTLFLITTPLLLAAIVVICIWKKKK